jgi:hypothetical protein
MRWGRIIGMKDIVIAEEDRRESPRVPMSFLVRDADHDAAEWEERSGDLGLGGISWRGKTAPLGREVDVRFRLPGVSRELRARGFLPRMLTPWASPPDGPRPSSARASPGDTLAAGSGGDPCTPSTPP